MYFLMKKEEQIPNYTNMKTRGRKRKINPQTQTFEDLADNETSQQDDVDENFHVESVDKFLQVFEVEAFQKSQKKKFKKKGQLSQS